jgi:hypothetical protein
MLCARYGPPVEHRHHGWMTESMLFNCQQRAPKPQEKEQYLTHDEFSMNTEIVKYNRLNDSLLLYAKVQLETSPASAHMVLTIEDITQKPFIGNPVPLSIFQRPKRTLGIDAAENPAAPTADKNQAFPMESG